VDLNTVTELEAPAERAALPAGQEGDAYLAGGTWLFSEPQTGLRRLVDLTAMGWPPLQMTPEGLHIAATCTLTELSHIGGPAGWPSDWTALPLVKQCCHALLGSYKVWNAATVGGNIVLSLPAGPMISLTAALDGIVTIWTADGFERRVPAAEFVTGAGRNVLRRGELVREVFLPAGALRCRTAFRQQSLSPVGRSAVLVIGTRSPDDGEVVLTVTASTVGPVQLRFAGLPAAEEVRDALAAAGPTYHDDVHGHPEWRRHLTGLLLEEVRQELAQQELVRQELTQQAGRSPC